MSNILRKKVLILVMKNDNMSIRKKKNLKTIIFLAVNSCDPPDELFSIFIVYL